MPEPTPPSINSGLEEELFYEFHHDRRAVDASWTQLFEGNGHATPKINGAAPLEEPPRAPAAPQTPPEPISAGDQLIPLRGPALRIAENMAASLVIPVATSQRVIAAKAMEENRRLINQHRTARLQSKISYTHLVAWAIVRALERVPPRHDRTGSAVARFKQSNDGHLHIRPSRDAGRRVGPVFGQGAGFAGRRRRVLPAYFCRSEHSPAAVPVGA